MSKLVDARGQAIKEELFTRLEAMDVVGKVIFVFLPGDNLRGYFGDSVWQGLRKLGATSIVFVPEHMKIEAFTDEDLAVIGLKRIEESKDPL